MAAKGGVTASDAERAEQRWSTVTPGPFEIAPSTSSRDDDWLSGVRRPPLIGALLVSTAGTGRRAWVRWGRHDCLDVFGRQR